MAQQKSYGDSSGNRQHQISYTESKEIELPQHPLFLYAKSIEKTHKGLGNCCAFLKLATAARKCIVIVGSHGSGKTTAVEAVHTHTPQNQRIAIDSITRSGLKKLEGVLTNYTGSLIVGDLGGIDTQYSVQESLKVLGLLAYEHSLSKLNVSMDLEITNFHGSCLTTVQPVAMRYVIQGTQWDAVLADKTIRYYHIRKPQKPNLKPITATIKPKSDFNSIKITPAAVARARHVTSNTITQWSDARSEEHLLDLFRSAAAYRGGNAVTAVDIETALALMRPLYLENYLLDRFDLEGKLFFRNYDFAVLSQLATWGKIDLIKMCRDYKVSLRTIQRMLKETAAWYAHNKNNDRIVTASAQALEVMEKCKGII